MSSYSWFDILLLVVVVLATLLGWLRGLVRELIGVAAALAGLILAANYYPNLSHVLRDLISERQARDFISFGIIFIVLLLLGLLAARMISGRISGASKFLNRFLGALFGFLKGAFFCGVIVLALTIFPANKDIVVRSRLAPVAVRVTQAVIQVVPKELKDRFVESYNRVVRIRKGGADGKKSR